MVIATAGMHDDADACRTCGACCAYSAEWPRFSLETDADLARIPRALVDDERGRMRCEGNRCAALIGEVAVATGLSRRTLYQRALALSEEKTREDE